MPYTRKYSLLLISSVIVAKAFNTDGAEIPLEVKIPLTALSFLYCSPLRSFSNSSSEIFAANPKVILGRSGCG